jgi:hypothetical protein
MAEGVGRRGSQGRRVTNRGPDSVTGLGTFGEVQGCHREWQGCHKISPVMVGASGCELMTNFKVATKVAKTASGGVVGHPGGSGAHASDSKDESDYWTSLHFFDCARA